MQRLLSVCGPLDAVTFSADAVIVGAPEVWSNVTSAVTCAGPDIPEQRFVSRGLGGVITRGCRTKGCGRRRLPPPRRPKEIPPSLFVGSGKPHHFATFFVQFNLGM